LGLPCAIENDVRAAAMGELYYGSAKGLKDFIYLNIGTGIAASIILNGKIHRGAQGLAGEIGHAMIDRDGPECKCGGAGCLEAFAAGPAIAEAAASRIKAGAESILGGSTIMSEGVFRAATQGDPLAKEILAQTGAHIAFALQFLILAFGPELVVLGGGVPMGGDLLIESVRSSLERQAHASWVLGQVYRPEMIQLTKLGEETGIIGASALIASLK
jgi:glucokinase